MSGTWQPTVMTWLLDVHHSVSVKFKNDRARAQRRYALRAAAEAILSLPLAEARNLAHPAYARWRQLWTDAPALWDGEVREVLAAAKGILSRNMTLANCVEVYQPRDRRRMGRLWNDRVYDVADRDEGRALLRAFKARFGRMDARNPWTVSEIISGQCVGEQGAVKADRARVQEVYAMLKHPGW